MRGINKVILLGNLGADPEVRYTIDGKVMCVVNLATSSVWVDKTTGVKQESAQWHRVVFFEPLSKIVKEYIKKGSKIFIEGYLKTRKWTDKAGRDQYITEVISTDLLMLDSKGQGGSSRDIIDAPEPLGTKEKPVKNFDDLPF